MTTAEDPWDWIRDEDVEALITADRDAQHIGAKAQIELENLEARDRARDLYRAKRMARLDAVELTGAGDAFFQRLTESALEDLSSIPDPVPVIDGLLYQETVNYLVGASGSFKTIVAVDMAARVGAGMDYCDMPVTQGKALYVIAEGLGGMKWRQKAWEQYHESGMQVTFIPFAVQIPDLDAEMHALIKFAAAGEYTFIVFDTQAMCTIGIDENSNEEMAVVINAAQKLANHTRGCVLIVAHTGHAGGHIRGASGQYANVNTVIAAKREGSSKEITLSTARSKGGKQKDVKEIEAIRFTIQDCGPSIVLASGYVDEEEQQRAGAPVLTGRYDVLVLNLMSDHPNLGVTRADLVRYIADGGHLTARGNPIDKKTIYRTVDELLGKKIIEKVPGQSGYRVSDLGFEALGNAADNAQ